MAHVTHLSCATERETLSAGVRLAERLHPRLAGGCGAVIAVEGPLGAGKTTFARGVAQGLGITEAVTSPTYQLVLEYPGSAAGVAVTLYHIDLYRVTSPDQLPSLALDDFIFGPGVSLVEWPERAAHLLPDHTIRVRIALAADLSRQCEIRDPGCDEA